jgi:hypothetical protein
MVEKRIVRTAADSLSRLTEAKVQVATGVNASPVRAQMNSLSKPGSPSSAMKKAGVALIVATPDPFTAVPGVALIASSYIARRKEPAKLDDLALETRKLLRDLRSLSL